MEMLEKAKGKFEQKKFKEAIQLFSSVINSSPNHTEALFHRALCYRQLQQHTRSLEDFNTILKSINDNASIISERAVTKFHLNDHTGALKDMDRAQELEPQNPYRYSSRAYIRATLKDLDGAIADYQKAIELDPSDAVALNNLGLLEEQRGRKETAKKHYKKSDELLGVTNEEKRIQRFQKTAPTPLKEKQSNTPSSLKNEFLSTLKNLFTKKEERKAFINFVLRKNDK